MREFIAIVGSRSYSRLDHVKSTVSLLPADAVVVTGDARGVDHTASSTARELNMEYYALVPCWNLGKSAGPLRNEAIVRIADRIIAFWDGTSRGTKSTIDLALRYGKPVDIVEDDANKTADPRWRTAAPRRR